MARFWTWTGCGLLALLAAPFALRAMGLGLDALWQGPAEPTRLWQAQAPGATAAIFAHMGAGGLLTVLAPLQLLTGLRRRWPRLHRAMGYGLAVTAAATALGGLIYIGLRGTIGGPWMSVGFATYGALMLLAAAQTLRLARAGATDRHRAWALRLVVLALGSWLYRVMYGGWVLSTGGAAMAPDFSGAFDRVMVWAFFVPWLLALEWGLRRSGPGRPPGTARGSPLGPAR